MLEFYTDGAASLAYSARFGLINAGGWGVAKPDGTLLKEGGQYPSTNNEMEMMAILEAIKLIPPYTTARIWTDSTIAKGWLVKRWNIRSNPYIKVIRAECDDLIIKNHIVAQIWKVKGHTGIKGNEAADLAASRQAKMLRLRIERDFQ